MFCQRKCCRRCVVLGKMRLSYGFGYKEVKPVRNHSRNSSLSNRDNDFPVRSNFLPSAGEGGSNAGGHQTGTKNFKSEDFIPKFHKNEMQKKCTVLIHCTRKPRKISLPTVREINQKISLWFNIPKQIQSRNGSYFFIYCG